MCIYIYIYVIEDIKTSSRLFGITQAVALQRVLRRRGKFIYLFRKERRLCTLNT